MAHVAKDGDYDLIIGGRESIDYNGGMVPGMIAKLTGANFVNTCISLEVEGAKRNAAREIDGGKETSDVTYLLLLEVKKGLLKKLIFAFQI